ncbi:hypothetical protein C8J55DRAFT_261883 [Lentinula edodes]|uniref:Uncharacterized protein n=1 Tax=Lentinula lateritia TaxID=40482 RepID=A0A9W8ZSI9_9AGAR|nr:hypothetical protein C8J55DRAFT_261883 [Lentinula edodes]
MTKLLFVLLILFVPQIGPGPNPINATSVNEHSDSSGLRQRWLNSGSSDVLLWFRYVDEWKATDYDHRKTLAAIPATADMIGKGAYLSPVLDQVEKYKGYWKVSGFFPSQNQYPLSVRSQAMSKQ